MPITPTLKELQENVLSDLESQLNVQIPLFGKNFLRALSAAQAGKLWLFYLSIGSVQKNIFIDTADPESQGGALERFGRVKLGRDPFPATQGIYTVDVTGTGGAVIKAGTTFKSNDDSLNPGFLYVLDVEEVMPGPTHQIVLRALDAGTIAKLNVGDKLTATAPIAQVDSLVTVFSEDTAPLAAEDIEDYRSKGIEAYQLEPQGGAASDYRIWSADAQGVAQVYPYAKSGASNEADVFVEATIADSSDSKGTPTVAILTEVDAVIEQDPDATKPLNERGRRPLTVFSVNVLPVTPLDVDFEIVGFIGLTPELQVSIENALVSMMSDIRPFISGADVQAEQNDVLSVNKSIFAIQSAIPTSTLFDSLNLKVDGNAVPVSYLFEFSEIPALGGVTYV